MQLECVPIKTIRVSRTSAMVEARMMHWFVCGDFLRMVVVQNALRVRSEPQPKGKVDFGASATTAYPPNLHR